MDTELGKAVGVAAYLAVLLIIGFVASGRMKDVRDYYAGGKKLGFLSVAFSARATGESAWLLLGLTGMGATVGVKAFWVVLGEILGVGTAWLLMARRFKRLTDRYDSITIPDYLESHFEDDSQTLRKLAALALVAFTTVYVSAQIDATGTAFESFLGWNYYVGALVGYAVVIAYIVGGGFVAVVWSDVFQGILMVTGLVLLPVFALVSVGGVSAVAEKLSAIDPRLLHLSGEEFVTLPGALSVVGLTLIGLGFLGSPQIFVRFLALKHEHEIPRGTIVALLWTLFADTGAVTIGLVGRSLLGDELGPGGQDVLPKLVEHIMPGLVVGLYIAIVLSAIMSTVDSLLLLSSSALVRDYYQKVRHPELGDASLVKTGRLATFGLASASLILAMVIALLVPGRTIFWFVIFGWSGIAATFCPTIILSLFWKKFSREGAIAAMISGFISVPLFKFGGPEVPVLAPYLVALGELPPAFLMSAVAGTLVSLRKQKEQASKKDLL